jgi:hypothetical protein
MNTKYNKFGRFIADELQRKEFRIIDLAVAMGSDTTDPVYRRLRGDASWKLEDLIKTAEVLRMKAWELLRKAGM